MAESYTKENYLREFLDKWDGKSPEVVGGTEDIIDILSAEISLDIIGD